MSDNPRMPAPKVPRKSNFSNGPGRGRPPGVPNKTTAEVRALAQEYGPAAIRGLAVLAGLIPDDQLRPGEKPTDNPTVKRTALCDLLARAYGNPTQPVEHSMTESVEAILARIVD